MIPLIGLALGAMIGAARAYSKGGSSKDIAQWAAVFAILFGIIGLFVMIFLQRSLT